MTLSTAHVVVHVVLAAMLAWAAARDFVRDRQVLSSMARLGVPESWLTPLGALKAAGAFGLLAGLSVPLIGMAAAVGVVLFFIGAIVTHAHTTPHSALRISAKGGLIIPTILIK